MNVRIYQTFRMAVKRWTARNRRWVGCACLIGAVAAPGVLAQSAPQLVAAVPANGATGVAVTSTLTYTFDQDMDTNVPLIPTVPGIFVGNFETTPSSVFFDCEWNVDRRTLTCTPTDDLPPNTAIEWRLNPAGALLPITSAAGTPLAIVSGSFTTGAAGSGGGGGGGGNEGPAPTLVSSDPPSGATAVPVTAAVVFVFDQSLVPIPQVGGIPPFAKGAVSFSGSGLDATKFSYNWSSDARTLTCDYAGNLPGGIQISWTINASDALFQLTNPDEVPVTPVSGQFTTAGSGGGGECDPDGVPNTWGAYTVGKRFAYQQTSPSDPTPTAEEPFSFGAFVVGPTGGPAVTGGSLTLPGGTQKTLSPSFGFLFFSESLMTEAALDNAYPGGDYILRFTRTGESERSFPMAMPPNTPPVPKIANFAEAQDVNASQDFRLEWNAFTGAGSQDMIVLSVSEPPTPTNPTGAIVFQAPDRCVPRELPVSATSIVIPAGTLQSNKTYEATLDFNRLFYVSTNAVPGMAGSGSISRGLSFTIKTGGDGGGAAPRFTGFRVLPNGNPELTLSGAALTAYRIERKGSLSSPSWTNAGVLTTDPTGAGRFEDTAAAPATWPQFYRAATLN